jgi:phosphoglycolate phosphatase
MASSTPVLLFDLDGTLVDTARTTTHAFNRIRQERGHASIEVDLIKPYISMGGPELTRFALGEALQEVDADLALFRLMLSQIAADPDEIYPGVDATLAALAAKGVRMAIVTNKPQGLTDQLLRALDLDRYFSAIIGGDSVPHKKPHPSHLNAALAAIKADATNAVLIGDSEVDAAAAAAVGMRFIHFAGGYCGPDLLCDPSHMRFSSYHELSTLLGGLP